MMQPTHRDWRQRVRTASGLQLATGLWLIVSPFLLTFSSLESATWNHMLVGTAVLLLAAIRIAATARTAWISWAHAALGVWLIAAPFFLGYLEPERALWSGLLSGLLVTGLAIWSAIATPHETAHRS